MTDGTTAAASDTGRTIREHPLLLAAFSGVSALIAGLGVAFANHVWSSTPAVAVPPPPVVSGVSVEWNGASGRYTTTGTVSDLPPGDLIWTYSQPYADPNHPGSVFPNDGPCPVDSTGRFACTTGWAGDVSERGMQFRLIAAVVTQADAYQAVLSHGQWDARTAFATWESVPRLPGDRAWDSEITVRPT